MIISPQVLVSDVLGWCLYLPFAFVTSHSFKLAIITDIEIWILYVFDMPFAAGRF